MVTKDLADSAALTVTARLAMATSAPILAMIGWLLVRSVQTVDAMSAKVDDVHERILETNGNLKLVQQSQAAQALILADHEARMRAMERMAKPQQ